MAVKLRLVRMGKKKQPTYRIVAADARRARGGAYLEILGTYRPRGDSDQDTSMRVDLDRARCQAWLDKGAQPTERVARLLAAAPAAPAAPAPDAVETTAP